MVRKMLGAILTVMVLWVGNVFGLTAAERLEAVKAQYNGYATVELKVASAQSMIDEYNAIAVLADVSTEERDLCLVSAGDLYIVLMRKYDDAVAAYDKAIGTAGISDGFKSHALRRKCEALYHKGDMTALEVAVGSALINGKYPLVEGVNEDLAEIYFYKGMMLKNSDDYIGAKTTLSKSIGLLPKKAEEKSKEYGQELEKLRLILP